MLIHYYRDDFVPSRTTHLREAWICWYLDVLYQLHYFTAGIFMWRQHLQGWNWFGNGL
jgi:hypothetical protein